MFNLKRITLALIVFYSSMELLIPNEAHAFGKKVIDQTTTPNTTKTHNNLTPVVVPQVKVKTKSVAPQPAQPVIKPAAVKAVEPKKVMAKKQSKIKAVHDAHDQETKIFNSSEQSVAASETSQPTAGQKIGKQVGEEVDSVSGFFGKLKESVNKPAIQSSCSTAQRAMSQC